MSLALVTGSSGFVGYAVASALQRAGYEVCGTVRAPAKLPWRTWTHDWAAAQDGSGPPASLGAPDLFVHCAFDPALTTHAEMARNAAAACAALGIPRCILISSGSVYAESDSEITQRTPVADYADASPYAKVCQDVEKEFSAKLRGSLLIVRLFYPYGPREAAERLIPRLVRLVSEGQPIPLRREGRPRLNPVAIDDVAEAVARLAAATPNAGAVNVGGPDVVTVDALAREIASLLGKEPRFEKARADWEARDLFCSNDALQALTGFKPAIRLRAGLARMLAARA